MTYAMTNASQRPIPGAEPLCTVPAVAAFLAVSRSSIYSMMNSGILPYVKLGKSRRIRWSDVRELVERHRVGGSKC